MINWNIITSNKGDGGLGIRDLSVVKKVMFAKRLLPLLKKEEYIWSKCFIEKYGEVHPWSMKTGRKLSWIARAVMGCMNTLRDDFRRQIGDETQTHVWVLREMMNYNVPRRKDENKPEVVEQAYIDKLGSKIFEEWKIEAAFNPLFAEAKAIWFGLDNTRKKGLSIFCIASDCSRLIKILKEEFDPPLEIEVLIGKIKNQGKELMVDEWCLVNREGNSAIHILAKLAFERLVEIGDELNEWWVENRPDGEEAQLDICASSGGKIGVGMTGKNMDVETNRVKEGYTTDATIEVLSLMNVELDIDANNIVSNVGNVSSKNEVISGCDDGTPSHVNDVSCFAIESVPFEPCKDLHLEMNKNTGQDMCNARYEVAEGARLGTNASLTHGDRA
ncbi:hypothetical protein Cni_G16230 [Canna indica]|uniref:RNase H type-1 domain-containing protein n=1 Tax=Canna indica TaxID=4628 RepID=A0AAQ3KEU8_9LILI|nr:hypothetical protein Cni_G16230 [Canna indica]